MFIAEISNGKIMSDKIRKAAVAGMFYPDNYDELRILLSEFEDKYNAASIKVPETNNIIGGIVPHAGYIYSGYHAMHFFKAIKMNEQKFDTVVILNPNHSGIGPYVALDENDMWETPFGRLQIDTKFYNKLNLPFDANAHNSEHSGEVMLPMLQYFFGDSIKIAPVSVNDQSFNTAKRLAEKLHKAVKETKRNIIIIASSDFSHFVSPEAGYKLDEMVCEKILDFDANGIYDVIMKNNISVCGYGPIMALIEYSKSINSNIKIKVLSRGHSGEVSQSDSVVDYVTVLFYIS